MFSLKPKKKNNQKPGQQDTNKPKTNEDKNKQNKTNQNKTKQQSKKVSKTIFQDPFNYHIQLLPQQQSSQVQTILIQYLIKLRQSMPIKPVRQNIQKVIKFQKDKNIKQKQSPLISQQLIIGIKRTKLALYKNYKQKSQTSQNNRIPHLIIIFYEEKKHQILLQLLSLIKILNTPYLLMRDNLQINRLLGVRTVGSLCFFNQLFANNLLKFIGKSLIDIPWVIQFGKLIDIDNQQKKKQQIMEQQN